MAPSALPRSRARLGLWLVATVLAGLASRRFPGLLPPQLSQYPGDALWALAVFWVCAFARPAQSTLRLAGIALAAAWAVEFLQLYHPAWLDGLRATLPGRLVLGSTFHFPDLAAHAVGIGLGCLLDRARVVRERSTNAGNRA